MFRGDFQRRVIPDGGKDGFAPKEYGIRIPSCSKRIVQIKVSGKVRDAAIETRSGVENNAGKHVVTPEENFRGSLFKTRSCGVKQVKKRIFFRNPGKREWILPMSELSKRS
jgi:hypothetical protein